MSWLQRLLAAILLAEVAVAGVLGGKRLERPRPPLPDFQWVDEFAARELRALWEQTRVDSPRDWKRLGDAYLAHGYFQEAEAVYRRAMQLDPQSYELAYGRGICLDKLGLLDDSIEALQEAVRRASQSSASTAASLCHFRIGKNLLRAERAAEAEAAFAQALPLPHAAWEQAKLLVRSGRASEALPLLKAGLEAYPQSVEFNQLQAEAFDAVGRSAEAQRIREYGYYAHTPAMPDLDIRALQAIRSQFGVERMNQECQALEEAGSLDAAEKNLLELLSHAGDERILVRLIQSKMKSKQFDAATALIQEYSSRSAPSPHVLEVFGEVWLGAGKETQAREACERAAKMGSYPGIHDTWARLHEKRGESALALRQTAMANHARGLAALYSGKLVEARTYFETALKLLPETASSWFYLGETLRLGNEPKSAAEAYRKCLALDSFHACGKAKEWLKRLAPENARP